MLRRGAYWLVFATGYRSGTNAVAFGVGLFAAYLIGLRDLVAQALVQGTGTPAPMHLNELLGISVWQLVAGVGSAAFVWGLTTMRIKRVEEEGERRDRDMTAQGTRRDQEIAGILDRLNRDHDDLIRLLAVRLDEEKVLAEIRARLSMLEVTRGRRREDHA